MEPCTDLNHRTPEPFLLLASLDDVTGAPLAEADTDQRGDCLGATLFDTGFAGSLLCGGSGGFFVYLLQLSINLFNFPDLAALENSTTLGTSELADREPAKTAITLSRRGDLSIYFRFGGVKHPLHRIVRQTEPFPVFYMIQN